MTELQAWVKTNQLVVFEEDGMLFGMDESIAEKRNLFKQHLRLRKSGIRLGALMKKGFVPDHELALSELLASNLRSIDLSLADARKYLRKDDLEIPAMPDGTCLVMYQNIALGWSKIIRNRLKNNYPVSWRIFLKGD